MLKRKRQIKEEEEEEGDSPVAKKRKTSSKGFCQCKKYSKINLVYQVAHRTYMCMKLNLALFPGPTRLSVTCSTEKWERTWYLFSR